MDIRIEKTEPYKSHCQSKLKDRIKVTLDMSMEDFSIFRKNVEIYQLYPDKNTQLPPSLG